MTVLEQQVLALLREGHGKGAIAQRFGISRPKVQRIARKYPDACKCTYRQHDAAEAVASAQAALDRVTRVAGDTHEVETRVPRLIRTEAEALAASEIDLAVWEPVAVEIRHYPLPVGDGQVEQGSYVKVRCKRRSVFANPDRVTAALIAGVDAAAASRPVTPLAGFVSRARPSVLRTRIITDLHVGGYAWDQSTGAANWDIATAKRTAFAANAYLDAQVPREATESLLVFLGDIFHYDTPHGTTTGGTQLDLDSRVDLMLAAVAEYAVSTVRDEAEQRPVTVLVLEGNHDRILSKALRRLLAVVFAAHPRVTVREVYTPRQYVRWGANLLGFTHGDGNRQRMVDTMAAECGRLGLWDGAQCRELHLGHVHHESAKQKVLVGAEALHGTVVRTHVALTPPDQYHADNAWTGNASGMSDWYYAHAGAMIGTRVAVASLLEAA